ncbi:MAG: hypothetical protein ACW97G_10070 [Candidatus Thorarchaeota archaeon]
MTITITDPSDPRINVNANATGVIVSAVYDYDGSSYDGVLTLNNTQFSYSDVRREGYTVDSVSGGTHNITAISVNGETWCIWDQIIVRGYSVLDDRVNVGDFVDLNVTVEYDFDDTPVTDGTLTINGLFATHIENGIWRRSITRATVGPRIYSIIQCATNLHGITDENPNGQSQTIIWDRIQILTTTTDNGRINVDSTGAIAVTARLEHDFHPLGSGDSLYLNDTLMTWNGTHFILTPQFSLVGSWVFFVNSTGANEVTHGISLVNLNGNEVDQIWDRIQILTTVATDDRVSYGIDTTTINVTAQLEHDSHLLTSGDTLYLNGVLMTWDTDHFYAVVGPYFIVDSLTFYVNVTGASEATYGITVVITDGNTADVIWDRLLITIGVDDATPDNGIQANFTLSVIFDFDNTACTTYQIVIQRNTTWWQSFTDANKSLFVDTNSDLRYTYTVQLVTSESTYDILAFSTNSQQVVWSAIPNNAPTNDADPVLLNPDDGYMFARYNYYVITSNVSDADGYGDIWYVELTLYDNTITTPIWTVRYNVSDGFFSTELGGLYIELSVLSYATTTGNDLDVTWIIKIDWDHPDMANMVPHQFVTDGIVTDSDYSVTTWDVETRLNYSSVPSLSDDRGDVGTSDLTATGGVTYYGSALTPLANETDIWVLHDFSGDWSGDLAAGSFSITNIGSSASVRLNTYTFKVVAEGNGSLGSDLYYTTSLTDTYITDRIEVYQAGVADGRININTDCEIWWRARYEYNGTEIQSGLTLILNGSRTLVWDASDLYWMWNETSAIPASAGFDVVSGSETGHGLTALSVLTSAQQVIWDSIIITLTNPTDQRINIGENATGILVNAVYGFDGADFDGSITLNNTNFVYAVAQRQGYTVLSVSGDTHNITTISSNDVTYCIWDSLTVTITDPSDQRQNVNVNATGIFVSAVYDYDGSSYDGTFTMNNTQFSYLTAQRQGYTVDSVSGGAHNITAISSNDATWFVWDSLSISIAGPSDQRININTNASGIIVTAVYDYDGSSFDGALNLNNTLFSYPTAQRQGYTVASVNGGVYNITAINVNDEMWCIWDSLTITITDPLDVDQRININANATGIFVSAIYDYDGSAFDGTLNLNNTQFSYPTAQRQGYTVDSVSGGVHNITAISLTDATWCIWDQLVITIGVDDASSLNGHQANFTLTVTYDYDDAVCITYQIVIDRNVTWWHSFIDANVSLFVDTNTDITYLYNASLVSSESTYGITAFTTNTLQVTWSLAPNELPVNDSIPVLTNGDDTDYLYARYRFYVITTSVSDPDGFADISYVELSLFPDDLPILYWTIRYTVGTDTFSVEFGGPIVVIGASSNAVGIGDTLTVTWHIKVSWDHADVIDSDVQQFVTDGSDNDSDFYETNWNIETRLNYSTVPSLSDDRGDINTADLIATGSVVYYGSSHSPLSNETDVWVLHDVSGTWSGDLTAGSFSISSIGSAATVRLNNYTFTIVAEGDGSGGTDLYFSSSLTDTFITDRIEIYEAGIVDGRIDINSDCEVWWRARYNYSGVEIQSGLTLNLNGSRTLVWDSGSLYWRWQETSSNPASAGFEVASASESMYGLTAWFNTTSVQQAIWDALIIAMTDPVDQRIDVGANATGILVSAVYAFDGTIFDGSFTLNNTNFLYATPQRQGYTVLTTAGDAYDITAILTNDVTFSVWDRVMVVSIIVDEPYHDPNDNARISVELQYEYDNSAVFAGTYAIAGYSLTHAGSGVWEVQVTISTYRAIDFNDLTTCNATLHGISEYNMNGNSVTVYWDRLEFHAVSVGDGRINVGTSTDVEWSVRLEDAGISITTGVIAQMTGDIVLTPTAGVYVATVTESTVGSVTYSILTASLGEIGQFIQSISDAEVIWDRVLVTSIDATPLSQDIDTATEIRVTLVYEFDSTPVTTGQVNLDDNGVSLPMSYNSAGGYWSASVTKNIAGNYTFTVEYVLGNTHDITSIDTAGLSAEVEWVGVPGFVPDTMTLIIIGGGVGVAVIGAAIVASRRRKGGLAVGVGDIEPGDFGVAEPAEVDVSAEPEVIEPEVEAIPEEAEPEVVEELEIEAETVDEAVEPEAEVVEEIPEPEETIAPVEEDIEIEPEPSVIEEPVSEVETELEVEEPIEAAEIIEEPIVEPEAEPEVVDYDDIPEEFIEPEIPVDLSKLTKKELLELIPDDIKETTSPKELKRLTKQELISLVESFRDD